MQIKHILTKIRNYTTRNDFIHNIQNFTKYNIQYITKFELTIRNPSNLSFIYPTVYESSIIFDKGNMRVIQQFQNNNIEDLMNEVSDFINREIKI